MKWQTALTAGAAILFSSVQVNALVEGDAKRGGEAYRICAACHSLKPGVHLFGPSLANIWAQRSAQATGYGRYTPALKQSGINWDENTLNAWLADPQTLVPGTTMTFRGVSDDRARADIIAFLRQATAKDGYDRVVASGLIQKSTAVGQVPQDLSSVGPEQTITAIRHCGDAFHITTANGATYPLWETAVRLKVDTSNRGPESGMPVLVRSGMVGDRVSVVFASSSDLSNGLKSKC